jgi:hypothetical protein
VEEEEKVAQKNPFEYSEAYRHDFTMTQGATSDLRNQLKPL